MTSELLKNLSTVEILEAYASREAFEELVDKLGVDKAELSEAITEFAEDSKNYEGITYKQFCDLAYNLNEADWIVDLRVDIEFNDFEAEIKKICERQPSYIHEIMDRDECFGDYTNWSKTRDDLLDRAVEDLKQDMFVYFADAVIDENETLSKEEKDEIIGEMGTWEECIEKLADKFNLSEDKLREEFERDYVDGDAYRLENAIENRFLKEFDNIGWNLLYMPEDLFEEAYENTCNKNHLAGELLFDYIEPYELERNELER